MSGQRREGNGGSLLNGYRECFMGDKNVLKLDCDGAATVENSLAAPENVKHRVTI